MKIGVLGGGQLGRMLALDGYRLGLDFRFLDPSPSACAGQVAELLSGDFSDHHLLDRFADGVDVATYEWENVPTAAVRYLSAGGLSVYPSVEALETAQDRLAEKTFFERLGIPTSPFAPIDGESDLTTALAAVGLPAVLKTRREGYDGKGQRVVHSEAELAASWRDLGDRSYILEGFVPFSRELSIVAARGRDGATAFYPLVENRHAEGILRTTKAPAPGLTPALQAEGEEIASRVLTALDYAGVLAVELFEHEGRLLANEMACRVHNSGHWTIEGAATSQFENHVRAVAGLPLGSTEVVRPAAMVNLIGDLPDLREVLVQPGTNLHLYGKSPRPGRKLGHVTVLAKDEEELAVRLARLERVVNGARSGVAGD